MKMFQLKPGYNIPDQIRITGEHRWILPGVICPQCGPWAPMGEEYPCIKLTKLQEKAFKRGPQSLEWYREEFPKYEIRAADGSIAKPGTTFGVVRGHVVHGTVDTDFLWEGYRTLLVKGSLIKELSKSRLKFGGVELATISGRAKGDEIFGEIQIEPGLVLSSISLIRRAPDCSICGRSPVTASEKNIRLQGNTKLLPDVFRARNYATIVFATDAFRRFCVERKLTNVEFVPVEFSSTR